jgi:DNA-binding FrmR family transcriptional regulator
MRFREWRWICEPSAKSAYANNAARITGQTYGLVGRLSDDAHCSNCSTSFLPSVGHGIPKVTSQTLNETTWQAIVQTNNRT